MVIYAAKQFGDKGYAEEVIGIGEESHASNNNCSEVIPLCFCHIKRIENL
jgi:hypothetical protein